MNRINWMDGPMRAAAGGNGVRINGASAPLS
jgi:hypothetical protein